MTVHCCNLECNIQHNAVQVAALCSAHLSQQRPLVCWVAVYEIDTQLANVSCSVQLPLQDAGHEGCLIQPVLHTRQQVGTRVVPVSRQNMMQELISCVRVPTQLMLCAGLCKKCTAKKIQAHFRLHIPGRP